MAGVPVRTRPHNLPAELTSFVGRRRELSEVKRLLTTTRLLTLTGSGGAGKTRLALRAAAEMARGFPDGVWVVPLAPIDDPQLVTQAVFTALGLQDMSSGWSLSTLSHYLADKQLLLVLDNCEHLLDPCALLAVTLLKSCPELRILATSRQALGTTGETRMRVPSLSLPGNGTAITPELLSTYEAVALLADRAQAVQSGFRVDRSNSAAVLKLCRRLDGIPLALELAAVRFEGLSADQVLRGLDSDLPVLGRGDRGAESRQQTLEATIGWSYGLLDEPERLLWARLSVFSGGFDEESAVTVCAGAGLPPDQVAGHLASLVEKSIVNRAPDGQPARYLMLETVRHYGRQRLRELDDAVNVQRPHRDWVLQLARAAGVFGEGEVEAYNHIQVELPNVWSALHFSRREPGELAAGIEICRRLYAYWWSRGPLGDVRRILDELYQLTAPDSLDRGWCAGTTALLAGVQNDAEVAQAAGDEALRIGRLHDNAELKGLAAAITFVTAFEIRDQPLKSPEELLRVAGSLVKAGRELNRWEVLAIGLDHTAKLHLYLGDLDAAGEASEAAVELCRKHGDLFLRGFVLSDVSEVRRRQGRFDEAEALAREGAAGQHALGGRRGFSQVVETLAWMASDRGSDVRAAALLGIAHQLRESIFLALLPHYRTRHEACEQAARGRLGAAFMSAFERGAAMSDDEALAFVLEQAPSAPVMAAARPAPSSPSTVLTRRELEIARLIAEGLTSQQIATRLFISERTVTTHVTNMLNKLGLSSRIQLASWVTSLGEPVGT